MADYKEILGSLVNRAKSAMDSSGVTEVYRQGADRAKSYARIARLTLDMNGQAEELRKVYTEIGKLYFEQAKDQPEGFFAPLFAQASSLAQGLKDKEAEVAAIREALNAEKDIQVEITQDTEDFDAVVNATEAQGKGESEE